MDPITTIVTALVAGAAAGFKDSAEQGIKNAYNAFKSLLQVKIADLNLAPLEKKPQSALQQQAVAETLADAGAGRDAEILTEAQKLISLIDTQLAGKAGITVEKVRAAVSVNIQDLVSVNGSIRIIDVDAEGGDANIKNLNATLPGDGLPNFPRQ